MPIVITQRAAQAGRLALRLLVAAGLAVDAYVHADLAPVYDGIHASISQGDLFRIEAAVAAAAALIVLLAGRRAGFGLGFAVAATALGTLLIYRYADVGALGPFPNMYEPSWFPEKTAAAAAEAVVTVLAACGLLWAVRHPEPAGRARRLPVAVAGAVVSGLAIGAVAGFTTGGSGAPAAAFGQVAAGMQTVTITGNGSLRFVPMTVHLHTGAVRITLKDSGAYPHNIVIPALHATSPTVTGDPGGTRVSFTITFRRAGRYRFYCQYHVSAGMTGMFLVS